MPEEALLVAERRSERGSRPSGRLRRSGRVPAVVYGLGAEVIAVTVPSRELGHILAHGANTVITLRLDGSDELTLARQVQRHPTRGELLHVDFLRVRTDVAISAEVPVHLVGEPEGVKDGGLLEQVVFSLAVEAKPQDIPVAIEHDVSALGIGDHVYVRDLGLPREVVTTLDPDTLVAMIASPRVAAEAPAAEALAEAPAEAAGPREGVEAGSAEAGAEGSAGEAGVGSTGE